MHIRDVLLGLTTYPNSTAVDAVKWSASPRQTFPSCRGTIRGTRSLLRSDQWFRCGHRRNRRASDAIGHGFRLGSATAG